MATADPCPSPLYLLPVSQDHITLITFFLSFLYIRHEFIEYGKFKHECVMLLGDTYQQRCRQNDCQ